MKYFSLNDFIENVISSLERKEKDFTSLDITDPLSESRLEGEESRFSPFVIDSFNPVQIEWMLHAAKDSPHVDELFLGYIDIDHRVSLALIGLFQGDRTWQRLALQGCSGQVSEICVAIMVSQSNVESLCLYHNELEYSGFCSLSMILASNPSKLTTLDLEEFICWDSAQALALALRRNTTLQVLDLHLCGFDDQAPEYFAFGLLKNRHLTKLQLAKCNLGDAGATRIIRALVDHPSISQVYLDCNFCHSYAFQAIARMLQSNRTPKLSLLSLDHQNAFDERVDIEIQISPIAEALHTNTTLKELSLANNSIDFSDLVRLALGVKESALESLNLSSCGISDEGASAVLINIPQSLKRLDLSDNPIGSEACQALLLRVANTQQQLESLHVDRDLDCWNELNCTIRRNVWSRRILSSSALVPLSLWGLILESINRIERKRYNDDEGLGFCEDSIFYMLKASAICARTR
jgi:hypothetical protein